MGVTIGLPAWQLDLPAFVSAVAISGCIHCKRRATLAALHAFLSWIPLGYIFESNLVEILLKHFPQPAYRNLALQCLTEVGAICSAHLTTASFC